MRKAMRKQASYGLSGRPPPSDPQSVDELVAIDPPHLSNPNLHVASQPSSTVTQPGAISVLPVTTNDVQPQERIEDVVTVVDEHPEPITAEVVPPEEEQEAQLIERLRQELFKTPVAVAVPDTNGSFQGKKILWFLLSAVILVAIVIAVAVLLSNRSDSSNPALMTLQTLTKSPTSLPTLAPTMKTRLDEFRALLQSLNVSGQELWNINTAQYQALTWLIDTDIYGKILQPNTSDTDTIVERYIMALLFIATMGSNWTNQFNFMSQSSICDWNPNSGDGGINCDPKKHIQRLYLYNNNLQGYIPTELGKLTNLIYLDIGSNTLKDTLPTEFGQLRNLQEFKFYGNVLRGTIPSELGLMSSLTLLYAFNNQFQGTLPSEIGMLSKMVVLSFTSNPLSGSIPTEVGLMSSLDYLFFDGIGINGTLPTELGNLTQMVEMTMVNNYLSGSIPSQLGMLQNLMRLRFGNNLIHGAIPTEIGNIHKLTHLELERNTISGSLPNSIGNLSQIVYMDISYNHLSGSIPSELGLLTRVTTFWMGVNRFNGTIPNEIGKLNQLVEIDMSYTALSRSIPSNLAQLTLLNYLVMSHNKLTGTVPSELTALSNLNKLYLHDNHIYGNLTTIFCSKSRSWIDFYSDCGVANLSCDCCTVCCDELRKCCDRQGNNCFQI